MSTLDEGGTVGTLSNVIGLRWDLVRVSGEECSPSESVSARAVPARAVPVRAV
jgi:hypothetical protein